MTKTMTMREPTQRLVL